MMIKVTFFVTVLIFSLSETSEAKLKSDGANVCKYMESRMVQVNVSTIVTRVTRTMKKVRDSWWGTRYVPIYRMKTAVEYHMVTRIKKFPVFYCCSGWMRADDGRGCNIPICGVECMNGGSCVAPDKCKCRPGFEGEFCQNDINECSDKKLNNCDQLCENTHGGYKCQCRNGYTSMSEKDRSCVDVDECSNKPCKCQAGESNCSATCINTAGSYKCRCNKGYELRYDTCYDINECIDEKLCDHDCTNLPGSYRCSCMLGYELNATSGRCIDIDECKYVNGGCSHKCHNVEGGYVCSCNKGYYLGTDWRTCKAIEPFVKYSVACADGPINHLYLSCFWPKKIEILHAFYGRVASDICMHKNHTTDKICSYSGIKENIAKRCDGKSSCWIGAAKDDFPNLKDPCPDISKYLVVVSQCFPHP